MLNLKNLGAGVKTAHTYVSPIMLKSEYYGIIYVLN